MKFSHSLRKLRVVRALSLFLRRFVSPFPFERAAECSFSIFARPYKRALFLRASRSFLGDDSKPKLCSLFAPAIEKRMRRRKRRGWSDNKVMALAANVPYS